jgi:hypothetical protein
MSTHAINWWNLGAEYAEAPALGWLYVTFFCFLYIIISFVYNPLKQILLNRIDMIYAAMMLSRNNNFHNIQASITYSRKNKFLDYEVRKTALHLKNDVRSKYTNVSQIYKMNIVDLYNRNERNVRHLISHAKKNIINKFIIKMVNIVILNNLVDPRVYTKRITNVNDIKKFRLFYDSRFTNV